jgi:hypothetical protein
MCYDYESSDKEASFLKAYDRNMELIRLYDKNIKSILMNTLFSIMETEMLRSLRSGSIFGLGT